MVVECVDIKGHTKGASFQLCKQVRSLAFDTPKREGGELEGKAKK
jgi:hypothetical protein